MNSGVVLVCGVRLFALFVVIIAFSILLNFTVFIMHFITVLSDLMVRNV